MGVDDNTGSAPLKGRPPAVLQIVPRLVSGGAERGTVELAGALIAAGWSSYVASGGGPLERDIARSGASHLTLPLASKNPLLIRRNAKALAAVIRRLGIDIVHARSRAPAWSAWSAASATGRHFVTTFHNAYDADASLKRWYNSVMARGERVIAISQFVADHAAQVYGIGPDRLRTIPRGVDLGIFDPSRVGAERVISLARQWRLPDGVPVVRWRMLPGDTPDRRCAPARSKFTRSCCFPRRTRCRKRRQPWLVWREARTCLDAARPAPDIQGMNRTCRILVVTTTSTRNSGAPGGRAR